VWRSTPTGATFARPTSTLARSFKGRIGCRGIDLQHVTVLAFEAPGLNANRVRAPACRVAEAPRPTAPFLLDATPAALAGLTPVSVRGQWITSRARLFIAKYARNAGPKSDDEYFSAVDAPGGTTPPPRHSASAWWRRQRVTRLAGSVLPRAAGPGGGPARRCTL
jgi:hypothetical protein